MNRPRAIAVVLTLSVTAGVFAAAAPPAKKAEPAPIPIAQQIDALLKRRLRPEPLPLDLPNPFALPGSNGRREGQPALVEPVTAPRVANPNEEARVATNADILAECASKLRIGGVMRVQGRAQLVINDAPRREGDSLIVSWNNTKVSLLVVQILADQVVLRYNDADISLRF